MTDLNRRMPRIENNRFAMVPKAQIPRSTFITNHSLKTTFDGGYLIPIFFDEVLPGDVYQGELTIFARLNTLLFPVMDNLEVETFFFYTPSRILWQNWVKMMGQRDNPSDSISYTVPQIVSPVGGFDNVQTAAPYSNSIYDYFAVPVKGQTGAGNTISINALPFRAYNMIYNKWFRDQNLINSLPENTSSDGPDTYTNYVLARRNKKHDYFTSALPWPLKGGVNVTMPLAGTAPVTGIAIDSTVAGTAGPQPVSRDTEGVAPGYTAYKSAASASTFYVALDRTTAPATPQIYADLSQATGATINALRTAFQTQRLLERDARGGTRYTETIQAHFGVRNPDGRLQRPEYIGGGRTTFQTSAIPQTSPATGGSTPLASLGAQAVTTDKHTFTYRATEYGYIIGLAHVGADLTYQQGLHRMWTRRTRYDFYYPVFAFLGEQAIRNDELWSDGSANDALTFGYQERWAEYRYRPGRITGYFRSTTTGSLDPWHLAQNFTTLPALNQTFISDTPPISRVLAAASLATGQQILWDSFFKIKNTRPMPMYSVPGLIDHF